MAKEVNNLETSTAEEIQRVLLGGIGDLTETEIKTNVRAYLRNNKLTPYEALEKARKARSSWPGGW